MNIRGGNPKAEGRNPKEGRSPKSEGLNRWVRALCAGALVVLAALALNVWTGHPNLLYGAAGTGAAFSTGGGGSGTDLLPATNRWTGSNDFACPVTFEQPIYMAQLNIGVLWLTNWASFGSTMTNRTFTTGVLQSDINGNITSSATGKAPQGFLVNVQTNIYAATYGVLATDGAMDFYATCVATLPACSNAPVGKMLTFVVVSPGATLTVTNFNGVDHVAQTNALFQTVTGGTGLTVFNDGTNWLAPLVSLLAATNNDTVVSNGVGAVTITVAGTANQITSSAGAQSIAVNRTVTLSIPTAPQLTNLFNAGDQYRTNGLTATTTYDLMASNNLGSVSAQSGKLSGVESGLGVTLTPGLTFSNSSLAAAGAQQASPALRLAGNGWKTTATAASQPVLFDLFTLPVQGSANPSGFLEVSNTINGGTPTFVLQLGQFGDASFGGGISTTNLTNSAFGAVAGVATNGADNVLRIAPTLPVGMMAGNAVTFGGSSGPITVPISGTYFMHPNNSFTNFTSDTVGITEVTCPYPGKVLSVYVSTDASPGAVANTVTVMTNGVATGTVATLNAVTSANDTAHPTIAMLAGTRIGIKLVTGAGTAVHWQWGVVFEASSGF